MRVFLLICFVGCAVAAPQGYNYGGNDAVAPIQSPHQQYGPAAAASFLQDLHHVMAVQSGNFVGNFPTAGEGAERFSPTAPTTLVAPSGPGAQTQALYLQPAIGVANNDIYEQHGEQVALVSKRFYLHSAPEEEEDEVDHKTILVGTPRKNFNVVFIKAPIKHAQKTSIKISPATTEEKTVIYVLAKKPETGEIDAHVLEPATTTAKPEVYFIKYRTADEAAHAQQTIQAQYESFGGSTQVSNEGVAPVSSVVGSLDVSGEVANGESNANAYLPPNSLRHK